MNNISQTLILVATFFSTYLKADINDLILPSATSTLVFAGSIALQPTYDDLGLKRDVKVPDQDRAISTTVIAVSSVLFSFLIFSNNTLLSIPFINFKITVGLVYGIAALYAISDPLTKNVTDILKDIRDVKPLTKERFVFKKIKDQDAYTLSGLPSIIKSQGKKGDRLTISSVRTLKKQRDKEYEDNFALYQTLNNPIFKITALTVIFPVRLLANTILVLSSAKGGLSFLSKISDIIVKIINVIVLSNPIIGTSLFLGITAIVLNVPALGVIGATILGAAIGAYFEGNRTGPERIFGQLAIVIIAISSFQFGFTKILALLSFIAAIVLVVQAVSNSDLAIPYIFGAALFLLIGFGTMAPGLSYTINLDFLDQKFNLVPPSKTQ